MNKNEANTTCPHCLYPYTLGVDGTVDGCDECMSIVRNPIDNTVIDEDTLTDMEKA